MILKLLSIYFSVGEKRNLPTKNCDPVIFFIYTYVHVICLTSGNDDDVGK